MTGSTGIPERGLKSARDLARNRPHGDRLRYMAGCKCQDCRRANSNYESSRQRARKAGEWNGLVDAGRARAHLKKLRELGVGRRAVSAASDVGGTVLLEINSGRKTRIRASTERRVLAVTVECASDNSCISAARTWSQINQLLAEGFTKTRIAQEIGRKRALQLGKKRITARNAAAIDRLWRKYMTEAGF